METKTNAPQPERECITCHEVKALNQFYRRYDPEHPDAYRGECKKCGNKRLHRNRYATPEKAERARYAVWAHQAKLPEWKKDAQRSNLRQRTQAAKFAVIQLYGGVCACCGEREPVFLTIDHVNNDGFKDRHTRGRSDYYYLKLLAAGRDPKLQILCWNCNLGKARNGGVCPHFDEELAAGGLKE